MVSSSAGARSARAKLLSTALAALRSDCVELAQRHESTLAGIHESHRDSARNLLHYVALRQQDLRQVQPLLSELGLSSLGRSESHVLQTLDAVLHALHALAELEPPEALDPAHDQHFRTGSDRLQREADLLLGEQQPGRSGRIMVTMPSEAAVDFGLVRDLVAGGMDVMRVNLAHDGPEQWLAMAQHLKRARTELGRSCRLMCDLAGPKLRTGDLEPGPRLLHCQPEHDSRGIPALPRTIWLHDGKLAPPEGLAAIPLAPCLVAKLRKGDAVQLEDARGKWRTLRVMKVEEHGARAELDRGLWLLAGAQARIKRAGRTVERDRVGELAPRPAPIELRAGDELLLSREPDAGHARQPARIPCTLPAALDNVQAGERVLFDDGKIACEAERLDASGVWLRVVHANGGTARLHSDSGINLPDSVLDLPDLTPEDLAHLDFVSEHADIVGLSFVRGPQSVECLQGELVKRSSRPPHIVAKIETRRAFDALPHILLAGLRQPPFGVLIARGDLAVEVGFQRLAEVQEEILWMCEAAHVPTIWATQVLDTLARTGSPTRAEVTDAAMSSRAECVMLNKGKFILAALAFLADVQRRMHAHTEKKTSLLRRLRLTHGL